MSAAVPLVVYLIGFVATYAVTVRWVHAYFERKYPNLPHDEFFEGAWPLFPALIWPFAVFGFCLYVAARPSDRGAGGGS